MGQANRGTCQFCQQQTSKSHMSRHVVKCAPNHDVSGAAVPIVQLKVEAAGDSRYWLLVEAGSKAPLEQLDSLLRGTWLECCGHLSAFREGRSELSMSARIGQVFSRKGVKIPYDYDFGSTTSLVVHLLDVREGSLGKEPVRIAARNNPPDWRCEDCSEPAVLICPDCIHYGDGLLCKKHAPDHECDDEEMYLPVVNSPRMGVCGYTG